MTDQPLEDREDAEGDEAIESGDEDDGEPEESLADE